MGISIKQFENSLVTPKDDAITYDLLLKKSGIISGCTMLFLGANQVKIGKGRGVIKGRIFTIEEEVLMCQMSDKGSKPGRLYIKMDLANLQNPIEIKSIVSTTLPTLVKDENCNETNGVYEIALATYTAAETSISGLKIVYDRVTGMDVLDTLEEISANTETGKPAGANAVKELNSNLGTCSLVTEGSGANTTYYIQKGADTASKKLLGKPTETQTLSNTQTLPASYAWFTFDFNFKSCAVGVVDIKTNVNNIAVQSITIDGNHISIFTRGSANNVSGTITVTALGM